MENRPGCANRLARAGGSWQAARLLPCPVLRSAVPGLHLLATQLESGSSQMQTGTAPILSAWDPSGQLPCLGLGTGTSESPFPELVAPDVLESPVPELVVPDVLESPVPELPMTVVVEPPPGGLVSSEPVGLPVMLVVLASSSESAKQQAGGMAARVGGLGMA